MTDYIAKAVYLKFTDRGEHCVVTLELDPPLPEDATLDNNEQPSILMVASILQALRERDTTTEEHSNGETAPYPGMRGLK